MPYHITVGKELTIAEHKIVATIIHETFREIDETVNNWNPKSEIGLINNSTGNFEVTGHLHTLLKLCQELFIVTQGRFDPTLSNKAWRLDEVLSKEEQTTFDLCGISKGYCIDVIAERLSTAGYKNIFVEWAGEIRAMGEHPAGREWTVQIEPGGKIIPLRNAAIATSGNYRQKHIINPLTGTHIEGPTVAATVIAPTCALADALATATMVFGHTEWAKDIPEAEISITP